MAKEELIEMHGLVDEVLRAVTQFADGYPPSDDRTLLAAQVV